MQHCATLHRDAVKCKQSGQFPMSRCATGLAVRVCWEVKFGQDLWQGRGGRAASREEQMRHEQLPSLQAELVEHRSHQPIELVLGPRQ